MRIKHWLFGFMVTFLLSTGLWAQSSAPRFDGAMVVNASYRGERYQEHHHRHHHHRHHHRHYR